MGFFFLLLQISWLMNFGFGPRIVYFLARHDTVLYIQSYKGLPLFEYIYSTKLDQIFFCHL